MQINTMQDFKSALTHYFKGKQIKAPKNSYLLSALQKAVKTNPDMRAFLMHELAKNEKGIQIFFPEEQVQIMLQYLFGTIKTSVPTSYKLAWLLAYVTDKVVKEVLSYCTQEQILSIMKQIKNIESYIGHRIVDQGYYNLKQTTFFSRVREHITWKKLYLICFSHLHHCKATF